MFFSVLRSLWVQGGERGYAACGNILCIPQGYPVYPPKDILHTPWRYPVYPLGICCIPPWDTLCTLQNPAKAFKHYVKSLEKYLCLVPGKNSQFIQIVNDFINTFRINFSTTQSNSKISKLCNILSN